jgi:hypothetical protein
MRGPRTSLMWKGALGAILFLTLAGVSAQGALAVSQRGAPHKAPVSMGVKSPGRSVSNPASWWAITDSLNPDPSGNTFLGAYALSTSDIWAVGVYQAGPYKALAEHWNGSSWSNISVPQAGASNGVLNAVSADASNDVWAVGHFVQDYKGNTLVEHWNGTAWSIVPSPNAVDSFGNIEDTDLTGISALASNDVWAVGRYINSYNKAVEIIEHWDGSAWSIVPGVTSGGYALKAVAAVSANDVWAVGANIQHWNGSQWSVVTSPTPGYGHLNAISVVSANNIWVAGYYFTTTSTIDRTLVEHWDGTSWTRILPPNPTSGNDIFYSISAAPDGTVYAVGSQDASVSGGTSGLIEVWNGTSWTVQTVPSFEYFYYDASAAFSSTDAWAMGYHNSSSGSVTLAEHYQPITAIGLPPPKLP